MLKRARLRVTRTKGGSVKHPIGGDELRAVKYISGYAFITELRETEFKDWCQ